MNKLIKKLLRLAIFITCLVFILSLFIKGIKYASGIALGASWMTLNIILTLYLLEIAINPAPSSEVLNPTLRGFQRRCGVNKRQKTKLRILLMIKFPLLYLFGLFILTLKIFPIACLLIGLGLAIISFSFTIVHAQRIPLS